MSSFLYNTATGIMAILVVAMVLFAVVEFKQAGRPNESANFPGKDYEGRISDGMRASPGLGTTKTKEYK